MESGSFGPPLAGVAVVLLFTYLWRQYRRPANFPPGPPNLPIVGSLPFLSGDGDLLTILEGLRRKYGNVFSMRTGENWMVVLSDYESIKEACLTRGKEFAGRPYFEYDAKVRPCYPEIKGVVSGDYDDEWKQQRHAGLTVLRDLGYGKSIIEKRIIEEADSLKQAFQEYSGQGSFDPSRLIHNAVTNIICSLIVNQRSDYKDQEFQKLRQTVDKILEQSLELDNFLPYQKYFSSYKNYVKECSSTYGIIIDFLKKHIQNRSGDTSNIDSPSCFIDGYLKMLSAQEGKMQNWLLPHLEDFFLAGMETTTTTLGWAVYFMVKHPEVQKKVQAELDQEIGPGRTPSLKDRANLPYTEATTLEIFRLASTAPVAVPHKTMCNTQVQGYNIPKGCEVIMLLWSVLRDPDTWPEPEEFRPERFLDQQGQLSKHEKLIPFGIGRRTCLGEQLARQEMFLFFTALLQSFTIRLPEGATLPPQRGKFVFTHQPPKINICIDIR